MQIRCTTCTKTIAIAPTGALPPACPHCAGAPVPARLGPFALERLVATGGMGEVYLARHAELGTEVALKLLPAMQLEAAASVRERFAREARLTASVQHPGVVRVLDCDVAGDRPYLVLEFVAGQTLRQRLASGPLPVVLAAQVAAAAADVLAAAHGKGVLHRDIKPDNVMLADNGDVRVLDFGIARAMTDDAPLTRTGEILGTPEYMAPEQLLDGPEATDERTDVHALGVLLYELLTARSPFRGANLFQTLKLVESLVPPPPSSLRTQAGALDAVVQQAMQKRREDRFATAARFAAAVRAAVPAAVTRPAAPSRAVWFLWLPLAAVLAIGVLGIVIVRELFHEGVRVAATAAGAMVGAAAQAAARVVLVHQMLADGRWSRALVAAEQGLAAGDDCLLAPAQDAFLFTHQVWPLAAGLPTWLGCCDERQRERLFGGALETPVVADRLANARFLLSRGDAGAALAVLQDRPNDSAPADVLEQRLLLLAAHCVGADATSLRTLHARLDLHGDALARLLSLRLLPAAERQKALSDYAALVPLEEPEHWLAQRCAESPAGSLMTAEQRAEMAWLYGAGELAVLLDAGLQLLGSDFVPHRALVPEQTTRLLRRVGGSDANDAPASTVLRALLQFAAGDAAAAELTLASLSPNAPCALRPFQHWIAAAKAGEPAELATQRGLAHLRLRNLEAARACLGTANTATARLCAWLLAHETPTELPAELPPQAWVVAAELVRGNTSMIERLLAAAAGADADRQRQLLRLAVLAGAEPDFTAAPWRTFAEPGPRAQFDQEVNGGLRR